MIHIYRKNENGIPVQINTISDKNATLNREIMGRDEINISLVTESPLDIRILDYILVDTDFTEHENKPVKVAYTINRPPDIVKKSDVEYQYTLIFESPLYNLMDKLVLSPMTRQSKFSINGTLSDFAALLLTNINAGPDNPAGTDSGWTVRGLGNPDLFPETSFKVLAFESTSCRDLLNRLSTEFGIEFYLRDKEIVFTDSIENETGLTFEQGKGKGLYSLSRKNADTSNTVTRAYLFGGSQNLPPEHTDPLTGQTVPIYRGGAERLTVDKGYIECFDSYEKVVERDVIFEDIFPNFEGTVQSVSGTNNTFVVCDMIDFDAEKYKIGTQSTVNFLSGALMGMAFAFNYNHGTHTIKLIRQEDDRMHVNNGETPPLVPNDLIKPAIGDTFNFLDIIMPPSYITNAENRLLEEGQRWFSRYNKLRVKYDLEIDHRYLHDQALKLHPGDIIGIGQPDGLPIGQKLRITAISTQLDTGKISCTLSNYITQSWEKQIEGTIQQNSQSAQIREEKAGNAILSTTKEWVGRNFSRLWGGNRIANEQHFTDNIYVGNDRVKSDVYIQGNVAYHTGNANKNDVDWTARNITVDNTSTGTLTASNNITVGTHNSGDLTVGGTSVTGTLRVRGDASAANIETNGLSVDGNMKTQTAIIADHIKSNSFNTGPLGDGWQISGNGNMEASSLKLRNFLEVPTLQYNKITVIGSEFWISDGGVIETVETLPDPGYYNIRLKIEEGDANPFQEDDILRGYFFSGSSFKVVRFYVKEIAGEQMLVRSFSPDDVPMPFMNIARMGNFDDKKAERQRSVYLSGKDGYIRFLDKVNDFEISSEMISMQLGNLDQFSHKLFGDCSGYSAFLENILMTGRVLQRSADGHTLKPLPVFKGAWQAGVYHTYDEVTHQGCRWLCVAEPSTSLPPAGDCPDWLKTVDKGDKGDTGATGGKGTAGATIRMRGQWQRNPAIPYISDTSWRDVVLFADDCYIVRPGHTVSGQTSPDQDTQNWEQFNEFENIITHVLLAGQGNIDVLGAGELFVGQTKNGAGWKMTGGKIAHTTSGLTLTADGRIEVPPGGLSIAGKLAGDAPNRNLLPNSDGSLNKPKWRYETAYYNGAITINNGILRLENNSENPNYLVSPSFKLKPLTTYTLSFSYRTSNIKASRVLVLPDKYSTEGKPLEKGIAHTSEWTHKVFTFQTPATLVNECGMRFDNDGASDLNLLSWLEVTNIMLVEGAVVGSWSRAPEDATYLAANIALAGTNLITESDSGDLSKPPRSRFTNALTESNAVRKITSGGNYQLSPVNLTQSIGFFHQWGGWQGSKMPVAPYADFYTLSFEYYFDAKPITNLEPKKLECLANLGKLADYSDLTTVGSMNLDYTPGIWHRMVMTMDLRPYKSWFTDEGFYFYIRLCSLSTRFFNNFGLSFRSIKLETGRVATPWRPDDENYYLREALAHDTTIEGGLLTTSIIRLGDAAGEQAGISGVSKSDVRAWFGGTYQNALSDPGKVGCIFNSNGSGQLAKGNIKWTKEGLLSVKGEVNATIGKIGGFDISSTNIKVNSSNGEARLNLDSQDIPPKASLSSFVKVDHAIQPYIKIGNSSIPPNYVPSDSNIIKNSYTWNKDNPATHYPSFFFDCYAEIPVAQAGRNINITGEIIVEAYAAIPPNEWGIPIREISPETNIAIQLFGPDGELMYTTNENKLDADFIAPKAGTYRLTIVGKYWLTHQLLKETDRYATLETSIIFPSVVTEKSVFSKTMIGTNGLVSIWETDNFFYYSKGDGFEVKKGSNALIVDSGGVKVINKDGVMPVNSVICGGRIDRFNAVKNLIGKKPSISNPPVGVTRVTHEYGSENYIVMVTVDAESSDYRDNMISIIAKKADYFDVLGKNLDKSDEVTPFYFTMLKTND